MQKVANNRIVVVVAQLFGIPCRELCFCVGVQEHRAPAQRQVASVPDLDGSLAWLALGLLLSLVALFREKRKVQLQ